MSAKRTDNKGRVLRPGESQRKNLTYVYRYTDRQGKRRCIYAPTLQELRDKITEMNVTLLQGVNPFSACTLSIYGERLTKLAQNLRDSTVRCHTSNLSFINRYPISQKRVTELKTSETKMWLLGLSEDGYSTHTVQSVHSFCKRACQLAVDDNVIAKNPFGFPLNFLPPKNKRTALTDYEQETFLDFIQPLIKPHLYDCIIVLIETGVRIGEFRGLTKSDINLDRREISVDHQLIGRGPKNWKITEPKTESGNRVVPLSEKAYDAILRLIARAEKMPITTVGNHSGFIALGRGGTILDDGQFYTILREVSALYNEAYGADIKVTPHVLRHTFCTNMYHKGLSSLSLQYVMGHSNVSTTFDIYTHNNKDKAIDELHQVV